MLRRNCLCFPVKTLRSARPPIPDLSMTLFSEKKNADDEVVFANKVSATVCGCVCRCKEKRHKTKL